MGMNIFANRPVINPTDLGTDIFPRTITIDIALPTAMAMTQAKPDTTMGLAMPMAMATVATPINKPSDKLANYPTLTTTSAANTAAEQAPVQPVPAATPPADKPAQQAPAATAPEAKPQTMAANGAVTPPAGKATEGAQAERPQGKGKGGKGKAAAQNMGYKNFGQMMKAMRQNGFTGPANKLAQGDEQALAQAQNLLKPQQKEGAQPQPQAPQAKPQAGAAPQAQVPVGGAAAQAAAIPPQLPAAVGGQQVLGAKDPVVANSPGLNRLLNGPII